MSSAFKRISVFDSAACQIYLFFCIYNILRMMEKLKSLASFYIYIFFFLFFFFFWGWGPICVYFLYLAQSNELLEFFPLVEILLDDAFVLRTYINNHLAIWN